MYRWSKVMNMQHHTERKNCVFFTSDFCVTNTDPRTRKANKMIVKTTDIVFPPILEP